MAISRVGSASAEATTVTIPAGHQIGDVMIIFAFRDGSATNPTIPAGWTNLTNTLDGTTCSVSVGWKVCASTGETSGTWTNATSLLCIVLRGVDIDSPFGTGTGTAGTTSPSTYGAVTLKNDMTSWLLAFQGHRSVDTTTLGNAPTSMTNLQYLQGATADAACFDTNGLYRNTAYTANTVAPGGTASGWITYVIEAKAARTKLNNYQFVKAQSGISVTERIR